MKKRKCISEDFENFSENSNDAKFYNIMQSKSQKEFLKNYYEKLECIDDAELSLTGKSGLVESLVISFERCADVKKDKDK